MQEVLHQLGIAARNSGASTGNDWAEGNGKVITSFSPVDGKKIAEVPSFKPQHRNKHHLRLKVSQDATTAEPITT